MVEEKEGDYIFILLACDAHHWVTDGQACVRLMSGGKKQRKQRSNKETNKQRKPISLNPHAPPCWCAHACPTGSAIETKLIT